MAGYLLQNEINKAYFLKLEFKEIIKIFHYYISYIVPTFDILGQLKDFP